MVLIHTWSFYAGKCHGSFKVYTWVPVKYIRPYISTYVNAVELVNTDKVYTWVPVKCGLYKQVVLICRWPLEEVGLYIRQQ